MLTDAIALQEMAHAIPLAVTGGACHAISGNWWRMARDVPCTTCPQAAESDDPFHSNGYLSLDLGYAARFVADLISSSPPEPPRLTTNAHL
jgi:hypothetical protein